MLSWTDTCTRLYRRSSQHLTLVGWDTLGAALPTAMHGIPFQEHFHTTISRWRKDGRRVKTSLQPVFKVCYNPSQFSPVSSSHLKSQDFFFLAVSYMTVFLKNKIEPTHTTYILPEASSVYFIPFWATILSYRISTVSCIFRKHMVEDVLNVSFEMDCLKANCLKPVLTVPFLQV